MTKATGSRRVGWGILLLVSATNLTLWFWPTTVVENIARSRPTLLGRYTVEHMTAILSVLILSAGVLRVALGTPERRRKRLVQVLLVVLVAGIGLTLAEFALRRGSPEPRYVLHPEYRVRAPHYEVAFPFEDAPEVLRSYPRRPPGYPTIEVHMRMDARGFRNPEGVESARVIAIGDSFVEAPHVTDEQLWTTRLAALAGTTVYNMGTSGENPGGYLYKLEHFAPQLHPEVVILMLYEGNDFRGFKPNRPAEGVKGLALKSRSREWLLRVFEPLGANLPVVDAGRVDWLPLEVPSGSGSTYYAFSPRKVAELYRSPQEVRAQRGWRQVADGIERAARVCTERGIRLVVAYAPVKPHVVLPLVSDTLDGDTLLAFTKIQGDRLPEAARKTTDGGAFLRTLLEGIDNLEEATREVCRASGVEFVSLTQPLRAATAAGGQTYFVYDQHWSPLGHEVVARALTSAVR